MTGWIPFKMFRKIDGINQYHHFSFEEEVLREGELIVCSDVPSRIKFFKDVQYSFIDEVSRECFAANTKQATFSWCEKVDGAWLQWVTWVMDLL